MENLSIPGIPNTEITYETGVVIGDKIWSETHIEANVSTHQVGNGFFHNHRITGEVKTMREFWLKQDDGFERRYVLPASSAVREGQRVTLIRCRRLTIGAYNHTAGVALCGEAAPHSFILKRVMLAWFLGIGGLAITGITALGGWPFLPFLVGWVWVPLPYFGYNWMKKIHGQWQAAGETLRIAFAQAKTK